MTRKQPGFWEIIQADRVRYFGPNPPENRPRDRLTGLLVADSPAGSAATPPAIDKAPADNSPDAPTPGAPRDGFHARTAGEGNEGPAPGRRTRKDPHRAAGNHRASAGLTPERSVPLPHSELAPLGEAALRRRLESDAPLYNRAESALGLSSLARNPWVRPGAEAVVDRALRKLLGA